MASGMITLTQMLDPAQSIQFTPSRFENEPDTIVVVFPDWKYSTVFYEEIMRVFKDREMSLQFMKVGNKLKVDFVRKNAFSSEGHIMVDYKDQELIDFINKVDLAETYIVLFGSIEDGQLVISLGKVPGDDRVAIVFSGYKIV